MVCLFIIGQYTFFVLKPANLLFKQVKTQFFLTLIFLLGE